MHAKSHQSRLTLCDPMDYSPPGSSVHGILQATILEWLAMPSSRGSSDPGIEPTSPALAGRFFISGTTWEAPNEGNNHFHFFSFSLRRWSQAGVTVMLRNHLESWLKSSC